MLDTPVVVPPWVPPTEKINRPTASAINSNAPSRDAQTLTVAGFNQAPPICYGEDRIGGKYLAGPIIDGNGGLVFAIGWSVADQAHGIEGVQTVFMDAAVATHQGSGVNQLYMVHYNGTQVAVDPVLAARFTAFTDKFEGIAYTAFRIPARATGGYPRIEAVVRGRRVFDPRNGQWAWTRNPGLCLRDFITDAQWGLGMTVLGAEAVADRCDSLASGEARSQIGLTLTTIAQASVHLDSLAVYAECLWGFDGDGVLLVPDAPVTAPAMILREADIREDTLRLTCSSANQSPTSVTIRGLAPSAGAEPWKEFPARWPLPGVDDGLIEDLPSDVSLLGVHRLSEGMRKAGMRLRRLQITGQVAFQMHDNGIRVQKGDVIGMPPSYRGLDDTLVRVLSNQMVGFGLYQITAEIYSASMYPDAPAPVEGAVIPVGGIIPVFTGAVPAGFERFTAADGRFLLGGATAGQQGGQTSFTADVDTSANGRHRGNRVFYGPTPRTNVQGSVAGVPGTGEAPDHDHTVTVTVSMDGNAAPSFRTMLFAKKTGAADQVPPNSGVFSTGQLLSNTMIETTDFNGRLLKCGSVAASGGRSFPLTATASTTLDGGHEHMGAKRAAVAGSPFYTTTSAVAVPGHRHSCDLTINYTPKIATLALYAAVVSSYVPVGAVIGWELSSGPIPAGWRLCDGSGSTINLIGSMPSLSSVANAGRLSGNNTISISGIAKLAGKHRHRGNSQSGWEDAGGYYHDDEAGEHTHAISAAINNALPPYHTLLFIQFFGVQP